MSSTVQGSAQGIMKKFFVAIVTYVVFSTPTIAEEIAIGGCPTPIKIQRQGVWTSATRSEAARQALANNPARKADVAAVFQLPDGAFFAITTLGSFRAFQGKINQTTFDQFRTQTANILKNTSKDVRDRLQKATESLAKGSGATVSEYSVNSVVSAGNNRFYVIGASGGRTREGDDVHSLSVQINQLVNGCVVTVNMGLPSSEYRTSDIDKAVESLVIK